MRGGFTAMWIGLSAAGTIFAWTACESTPGDSVFDDTVDDDSNTGEALSDSETGSENTPDVISGATPGVSSALLKSDHAGWGQMNCYSCHDEDHVHNYAIGDCTSCHGKNGAPKRHLGHADSRCEDCHAATHDNAMKVPEDSCRACHAIEASSDEECAYNETYDAVVIGGGGGGLAAAAVLAKSKKSVLLVEQHYKTGGCMVVFNRGEYRFEATLHAYDGWGMSYLSALGIKSSLVSKRGDYMYRLALPDMTVDVPADKDAYLKTLKDLFPKEASHLDSLFDHFGFSDPLRYEGMSLLEAVMSEGIEDERLLSIFTALSGFLSATPDELPALDFLGMWDSYHSMGYYYFEGGSQSITDALEKQIEDNGGVIKRHTRATRIVVEDNRTTGVKTDDGGCIAAKAVISNASTAATFLKLVGADLLPEALVDEVKKRTPSRSNIAMVFLGVDADYTSLFPKGAYEMFVSGGTLDTSDRINEVRCTPEAVSFVLTDYSVADPKAAPDGKNAIVISADFMDYDCADQWNWGDSYASYEDYKQTVARVLVERAEAYLPGLSDHIEVMEVASPKTIEQFTLSDRGSWAGWAFEPDVEHVYTNTNETPIDGLYLAGSWVSGGGQSVALSSGMSAANAALTLLNP